MWTPSKALQQCVEQHAWLEVFFPCRAKRHAQEGSASGARGLLLRLSVLLGRVFGFAQGPHTCCDCLQLIMSWAHCQSRAAEEPTRA